MKALFVIQGLFSLPLMAILATDDNEFYVFAKRNGGCETVKSIEPCPVTWKLSPFAAKFYNQQTKLVNTILTGLELSRASDECKDAMKTTMCGQAAPKCSDADGSQDYGNVAEACPKIYSACPSNIGNLFKAQKLCDKVLSGKMAKPKCVVPHKIEGNCPQPKYKMPSDALHLYERNSADNNTVQALGQLPQNTVSSNCTSQVQELQCMPVYCSEDEEYLLSEFTSTDCEKTIKHCLTDPFDKLIKLVPAMASQLNGLKKPFEETCDVYPNGTAAAKQAPPPTAGAPRDPKKVGPTGSGNIQLLDCVVLLLSFVVVKLFT